jgi:hypothetical protein
LENGVRQVFCRLIVLLSCAAFAACTSLHTLVDTSASQEISASEIRPAIGRDDSLTVTTRHGAQTKVHVTTVTSEFIEGTQDKDKQLKRFQLSDVVKIERREFDGLKTAILVVSIAVGVYVIAYAYAGASLLSGV